VLFITERCDWTHLPRLAGQLVEAATYLTVSLVISFKANLIRECEQALWFSPWSGNFNRPAIPASCQAGTHQDVSKRESLETACYTNHVRAENLFG
jgi:hypothetical protein